MMLALILTISRELFIYYLFIHCLTSDTDPSSAHADYSVHREKVILTGKNPWYIGGGEKPYDPPQ